MQQLFYYKMWRKFITKCNNSVIIEKVLQNTMILLQMRLLSQNAQFITKDVGANIITVDHCFRLVECFMVFV